MSARGRAIVREIREDVHARQDIATLMDPPLAGLRERAARLEDLLATLAPKAHQHVIGDIAGLAVILTNLTNRIKSLETKVQP